MLPSNQEKFWLSGARTSVFTQTGSDRVKVLQRVKNQSNLKFSSGWTCPQFSGLLGPQKTVPGCDQWWEEGFVPAFSEGTEAPPARTLAEADGPWWGTMLMPLMLMTTMMVPGSRELRVWFAQVVLLSVLILHGAGIHVPSFFRTDCSFPFDAQHRFSPWVLLWTELLPALWFTCWSPNLLCDGIGR